MSYDLPNISDNQIVEDNIQAPEDRLRDNICLKLVTIGVISIFTITMIGLLGLSVGVKHHINCDNLATNISYIEATCIKNNTMIIIPIKICNQTDQTIIIPYNQTTNHTTTNLLNNTLFPIHTIFPNNHTIFPLHTISLNNQTMIWDICWYQENRINCTIIKPGSVINNSDILVSYQKPKEIQQKQDHLLCLEKDLSTDNNILVLGAFLGICLMFTSALLLSILLDHLKIKQIIQQNKENKGNDNDDKEIKIIIKKTKKTEK